MSERPTPRLRSLVRELGWLFVLGTLLAVLAVSVAGLAAVEEEVAEQLDDTLRATAQGLAPLLAGPLPASEALAAHIAAAEDPTQTDNPDGQYGWLLLDAQGQPLLQAGPVHAKDLLEKAPKAGFNDTAQWRLYGQAVGHTGRLLLVAQSSAERREAHTEVAMAAALAVLAVSFIGLPLLFAYTRRALRPLGTLSDRLAASEPDPVSGHFTRSLGPAERDEFVPIVNALVELDARLVRRLRFERAFTAQAAHLLRTPLAGIDAQLAVALREQPGQARLLQVRHATTRLQTLVVALLRLFRSTPEVRRQALDARQVLAELPLGPLQLLPGPPLPLQADSELLAAALLNLLDNAQRHGGHTLRLQADGDNGLSLHNDGQSLPDATRLGLQAALQAEDDGESGLGLRLADLVARAHGGHLELPLTPNGFAVTLHFGPRA